MQTFIMRGRYACLIYSCRFLHFGAKHWYNCSDVINDVIMLMTSSHPKIIYKGCTFQRPTGTQFELDEVG